METQVHQVNEMEEANSRSQPSETASGNGEWPRPCCESVCSRVSTLKGVSRRPLLRLGPFVHPSGLTHRVLKCSGPGPTGDALCTMLDREPLQLPARGLWGLPLHPT